MPAQNFLEIGTFSLPLSREPLSFDIYLRLAKNKYTKVFHEGVEIEQSRFDAYIVKGIQAFYIDKADLRKYNLFNQRIVKSLREEGDYKKEEALQSLDEFATHTLGEIYETNSFDEKSLDLSLTLIHTYLDIAKHEFTVLPELVRLARKKKNLLKHSIQTSIFSVLLARSIDPNAKNLLLSAGLTGLLHDIGLSRVPFEVDELSHNLTPHEKAEVEKHPLHSVNLLAMAPNFPNSVKEAILQHHEAWDGSGYPQRLKQSEICVLARMVAVADHFTTLTSATGANIPLVPGLAVNMMIRNRRLDPELVRQFARMLNLESAAA